MEKDLTIKIRDNLRKIKVYDKKRDKEIPVPLVIRLDNETYVYERYADILWDDEEGIGYYFHYNPNTGVAPIMIGRDKIEVPVELGAFDYEEIQEIKALLGPESLESAFKMLDSTNAKPHYMDEYPDFTETMKQKIRKKYLKDTMPDMDTNFYVKPYNK